MKTNEIAKLLGVSISTIKLWSKEDFKEYLTEGAKGGSGRSRHFTDLDIRILTLVAELRSTSTPIEDIHATLKSMKAADWSGLPDRPVNPPGEDPISVIPREAAEAKIDLERKRLLREVSLLQEKVEDLEDRLKYVESDRDRLQSDLTETKSLLGEATGQLKTFDAIQEDRDNLQSQLIDTKEKLGRSEGQLQSLDVISRDRDRLQSELTEAREKLGQLSERQPTAFWLRLIAVIVTVTIVALILIFLISQSI